MEVLSTTSSYFFLKSVVTVDVIVVGVGVGVVIRERVEAIGEWVGFHVAWTRLRQRLLLLTAGADTTSCTSCCNHGWCRWKDVVKLYKRRSIESIHRFELVLAVVAVNGNRSAWSSDGAYR